MTDSEKIALILLTVAAVWIGTAILRSLGY